MSVKSVFITPDLERHLVVSFSNFWIGAPLHYYLNASSTIVSY